MGQFGEDRSSATGPGLHPPPASGLAVPQFGESVLEGILLIAHGSRRPAANADLVTLADLLASAEPGALIEVSYLELAEPDIQTGGARCVERGAGRVRMLPYFLSAGAHVVEDLREHQAALAERFPGVEFQLCPHLGLHPLMVEIVRQRLRQIVPSPPVNVS